MPDRPVPPPALPEPAAARPAACCVCRGTDIRHLLAVEGQDYWRCDTCEATFLDPAQRLSRSGEHAEYRRHDNNAGDPDYRDFLARLAAPLLARLAPAQSGLDYGCGAASPLAGMLRAAGHRMQDYDPLFFPQPQPFDRQFDFITCTETAEHFHDAAMEFDRLGRMLRPGGWLAVMTCFQTDDARFARWHYRRDPTHVVFYREQTFRHLAAARGWDCVFPVKDVALMRLPS